MYSFLFDNLIGFPLRNCKNGPSQHEGKKNITGTYQLKKKETHPEATSFNRLQKGRLLLDSAIFKRPDSKRHSGKKLLEKGNKVLETGGLLLIL